MIFYDYYGATDDEVRAFVREMELGRLVTVSADGHPHIGLYPFVFFDDYIEIHLNARDEQVADLAAHPQCVFEVDEVLADIPSYWVHPENASMATAYHQTVIFDCTSTMTADGDVLAAQQSRVMDRYQPEGGFRPITIDDPMYRGMLGMLVAIRLDIVRCTAKFKIGQNRPPEIRARIIDKLKGRGRVRDGRAAAALQRTLDAGT
ncbi:MAG TPA: FMN-binding negative transcriptional regulator [Acidothermaceae bacterium]